MCERGAGQTLTGSTCKQRVSEWQCIGARANRLRLQRLRLAVLRLPLHLVLALALDLRQRCRPAAISSTDADQQRTCRTWRRHARRCSWRRNSSVAAPRAPCPRRAPPPSLRRLNHQCSMCQCHTLFVAHLVDASLLLGLVRTHGLLEAFLPPRPRLLCPLRLHRMGAAVTTTARNLLLSGGVVCGFAGRLELLHHLLHGGRGRHGDWLRIVALRARHAPLHLRSVHTY